MSTSDMKQAREWAESIFDAVGNGFPVGRSAQDTAQFVKSLPDEWIDAEKVQELIDAYKHARDGNAAGTEGWVMNHLVVSNLESLLPAPQLPTLAELTRGLDKDIEQYRWMQAEVFHTGERGAITDFNLYAETATVLFPNGVMKNVPWEDITPRPDLPRLEWPGGGVGDAPVVDGEPTLPLPEDVKPGDYWLVRIGGRLSPVAAERDHRFEDYPWTVLEGRGGDHYPDTYVTLVSRLVPEDKP